jgi:TolB-like protein/Tfp pilus assembly protein PilF
MGVVYQAYDLAEQRPVAIKMLSAKVGDDLVAILRFKREARTASSLSHPAICRIFDIGDYRGRPFIVMELLEGETVKRWLARGQCEPARILDVAVQVTEGLQRAHTSFIVHRDIKPANVFITHDGVVKLLDFGLAKHFARLDPTSSLTVTEPHHTPGTVDYMSPEQLLGKRLDQRTDLYSLGVLLYEVLCGRRPFEGATTAEKIAAILDSSPPPLPPMPHGEEWRQVVVERLLAKEPEHRYADAAALLRDLGLMKQIVQGLRVALPSRASIGASTRRRPSIAVLPFDVQARPGQEEARHNAEYFSHNLVDELIIGLTRMGGVHVVPRTLATRSSGRRESITRIARRVHADQVISGVVKAAGERLAIAVTLYDAAEKAGRWTRRYQCAVEDLFKLRDQIVRAVAAELQSDTIGVRDRDRHADSLADRYGDDAGSQADSNSHRSYSHPHDAETRLSARDGQSRRAFHLCLKGRFFWSKRYEGGLKTARECFEEALRIDPNLALAHAGLADTYSFLGFYCLVRPRDAFAIAKTSVERALALDEGLAEAHTSLGLLKLGGDWDWHAAVRAFQRAIEIDPSHAPARIYLSWTLVLLGRFEEAHEEAERAQDIDPLSPQLNAGAAYTFFLSRAYERGIRECEKALEVDKEFLIALYVMGMCKAQLELYDEAVADLERTVELSRGMPFYLGLLGKVYADMGRRDKVLDVTRQLGEQSRKVYVPPHCHVYIHAGLGDFDTAFEWQDQAFLDGASPFNYFSPIIECLHQDPRFKADLRAWGLEV